jgi:hypothetical protein
MHIPKHYPESGNYIIPNPKIIILKTNHLHICTLCLLMFSVGILPLESYSQNFNIKGILRNGANDEYISGATIILKETQYFALSDDAGNFTIPGVMPGNYVMTINFVNFQGYQSRIEIKDKDLNLGMITLFPYGFEDPSGAALQKTIRATNVAELFSKRPNFVGGQQVFGIPPEPKRLFGNFYLDQKWNKASILLYRNDEIMEGYLVRYNINSNNFEIRAENSNEASTLPGIRVRNIVLIDAEHKVPRYFVNGMDFRDEGAPIAGFFEVLVDGKMPLVRRTVATIRESNYNQALMVGDPDDRIVKRNVYYYLVGKNLFEVPKKKKRFFEIFGEKAEEMMAFAEENRLETKNEASWFSLFTHYNSQFEGFAPLVDSIIDN